MAEAAEDARAGGAKGVSVPLRSAEFARLLLLMLATCVLALAFKGHCMLDGGWSGSEQYTTGCYSDVVPFWGLRGVAAGEVPYFQARLEYPVLTGLAIWMEGGITRALFGASGGAQGFLVVATLANAALAVLVLAVLARMGLPRRRLRWWAAAPPVVLYLGHNWDMVAVAIAIIALHLAQQGRLTRAAAAAGLGVAAKLFPVVMLPLLALRPLADGRFGLVIRVGVAAVAAWTLVNLPVALAAFANWSEFYTFSESRGGTAASFWELAGQFGWLTTTVAERNLYAGIGFLAGAAAIVAAGWGRNGDRPWVLFTPVLAWFMLTNKVYSPQFDLWIYPAMLVTVRRPWPILLFVVGDVLAYFAEFWWFAGMEGAYPATTQTHILLAAAIRAAAMLWVIADGVLTRAPDYRWQEARGATGSRISAPA